MTIPTVSTQTENTNVGTSIDLTQPTSWASGDGGLIIVGDDDNGNEDEWTDPTDWTDTFPETGTTVSDCHLASWYIVADGTEADPLTLAHVSSDDLWGYWLRLTDIDTTTMLDGANTPTVPAFNQSTHVVPSFTTTVADCLAFYCLAFDGGDGLPFSVSGTGWSEGGEIQVSTASGSASGCWGTNEQATASAAGDATVTSTVSDGSVFVQFAIRGDLGGAAEEFLGRQYPQGVKRGVMRGVA